MHETTARLLQAAAEVGKLTMPSKVAIALGESQQTLKHWEKRGMSKGGQLKACELWGLSPAWLREGVGPMLASDAILQTEDKYRVAQLVSHQPFTLRTLSKEELMGLEVLPDRFVLALPDDAMGEHGRVGTEVLFHAAADAKIGAGVLVRDASGELHVRRKAQGKGPDHWIASAPNNLYRDLDSAADGLKVLAVWRGVVNRGLED